MSGNSSSKKVVYTVLIGNLMIAITKAGAATWTGSSAMLSEAIHSEELLADIDARLLHLESLETETAVKHESSPVRSERRKPGK